MEWIESTLRDVGSIAQDDALVRGATIVGGLAIATMVAAWRTFRGSKVDPSVNRVKIDAPNNVSIKVRPVDRRKDTH